MAHLVKRYMGAITFGLGCCARKKKIVAWIPGVAGLCCHRALTDHLSEEILRICLRWVRDCLWDLETYDSVVWMLKLFLTVGYKGF